MSVAMSPGYNHTLSNSFDLLVFTVVAVVTPHAVIKRITNIVTVVLLQSAEMEKIT